MVNLIKKEEKGISVAFLLIIIGIIIIAALFSDPLPKNCHRTPSVDVGGGEVECD